MFPKNRAQSKKTAAAKINKFVASRYKNVSIRSTPELKWLASFGSGVAVQNVAGTPLVQLLNGIAQGVGRDQRTGNKIVLRQMYYNFSMQQDLTSLGTTTNNVNYMNVALVWDKQPNGAAPTYPMIFNTNGGVPADPFALPNVDYNDRFTILAQDKLMVCSSGPNATEIKTRFIPLRLETKYSGTNANIASIITGALYLVACSSYVVPSGYLTYSTRLLYDDQ